MVDIRPEQLLAAYARGYFPMAEGRHHPEIYWYYPEHRGIIPLESFHLPRSLAKALRKQPFTFTTDRVFPEVIAACAETHKNGHRRETWINDAIISAYVDLWRRGFGHSVECWQDGSLVGGLYGIALGGAFFGESMFSRVSNASKASLVHLVGLLREGGYGLLDTQFVNDHLLQFGVQEIPRDEYLALLADALQLSPNEMFRTD